MNIAGGIPIANLNIYSINPFCLGITFALQININVVLHRKHSLTNAFCQSRSCLYRQLQTYYFPKYELKSGEEKQEILSSSERILLPCSLFCRYSYSEGAEDLNEEGVSLTSGNKVMGDAGAKLGDDLEEDKREQEEGGEGGMASLFYRLC